MAATKEGSSAEKRGAMDKAATAAGSSKASGGVCKPDEKAFRAKIAEETRTIDELKSKLVALNQKIGASSGGREEFIRKKNEIRSRLEVLQEKDDKLEAERKQLFDLIDHKQKEGREMRANVQNMKKSLGYMSETDIDKKIQEIEELMMTSTISLKEEKKLMQQISQLKSNKPLAGKYANLESTASTFEDSSIVPLKSRLDKLREELNDVRNAKKEETEKFKLLTSKRSAETGSVKEFFDQKESINKELSSHFQNRRLLQEQLHAEVERYNNYMAQLAATRNERIREERKKKATEAEKMSLLRQLEKVDELPLENEVVLLQQTIKYVQKLLDERHVKIVNTEEQLNNGNHVAKPNFITDGGEVPILPKKDREEEYYFAPKVKKTTVKKTSGKQKSKALKLDLGVISIFEQCGVDPPVTTDDLENCLTKLGEKLDEFKNEQAKRMDECKEKRKELHAQLDALNSKTYGSDTKLNDAAAASVSPSNLSDEEETRVAAA